MSQFDLSEFPRRREAVSCKWAPILFHPIPLSPERLIIGVLVCDDTRVKVVGATALDRLNCLFGKTANELVAIARLSLQAVEEDIQNRGLEVMLNFTPPMSGLFLGEIRQAEGRSLDEVASHWLEAASSLHEGAHSLRIPQATEVPVLVPHSGSRALTPAKLRSDIREYIALKDQSFWSYFSEQAARSSPNVSAARPILDYSGRRLAANFGILNTNHFATLNGIKRRMWDLSIDKIRSAEDRTQREHEMIVQYPTDGKNGADDKVLAGVKAALKDLEAEADISEIRLRPLTSVKDIAEHLLAVELAA